MDYEPSGPFITSVLELKLDANTMFEWQKSSQDATQVPHYRDLLEIINLRAQASETSLADQDKKRHFKKAVAIGSYHTSVDDSCTACKSNKHPLYACHHFRSLPHDQKRSLVKKHKMCLNCLKPGHFASQCPSTQRCKKCQRPHHSLLHSESKPSDSNSKESVPTDNNTPTLLSHVAHADATSKQILLMTCRVLVITPGGQTTQARALLDSASSTSFVSERLAQLLRLPRRNHLARIAGIGGMSHRTFSQSVVNFRVAHTTSRGKSFEVQAIVLPKVTSELPHQPVAFDKRWTHLSGIQLADPDFGSPGHVDILLGVDVFSSVVLHGRRFGTPGCPSAFQTCFGWVLSGVVSNDAVPEESVVSYHSSVLTGDDLLRSFWEVEDRSPGQSTLSPEEKLVMDFFATKHYRDEANRFVVPLPKKLEADPLGESRSQAVRRFLSLERSLRNKGQFQEFATAMDEMAHAELVPEADLQKPCSEVFYMPMQAVVKSSSTTTKVRAVFDASAKTSSGVSLNDQLLVGPTVHSPLINVLMRFRLHRIAFTTDVSRMYRAVVLHPSDRDLHRFVWRRDPEEPIKDFRMTRLTFGVSASSFIANMCVRQNADGHACEYPKAALAVRQSFYVDDGLVGADSLDEAVELRQQLQELFSFHTAQVEVKRASCPWWSFSRAFRCSTFTSTS